MNHDVNVEREVRELTAALVAEGHKVTIDYCVTNDAAAIVIRRKPKTLRNWRHAGCGPRWEKLVDGSVWYRLVDLLEWKKSRAPGTTRDMPGPPRP